jgi:hypothetical protein
MIDWNKSAELNNCTMGYLKKRYDNISETNWLISGICDSCKSIITERKIDYSDICLKCKNLNTKKPKSKNNINGGK